ncbi:MAG TPA: PilZ domain-containing protein [Pirellulales bacterium]|nr:PilZ domain-containing protein [Pirellulales bacterium]
MSSDPSRPAAGIPVSVTQSKEQVFAFARDLLNHIQADYIVEQRAFPRHPVCVPIEVIVFDKQGRQTAPPFVAVAKDISATGLSFLHDSAIGDPYLLVRFPDSGNHSQQWLVLEFVRGRRVGKLWEIGGRSVAEPSEN